MQRDFAKVLIKTAGLVVFVYGLTALVQSLLTLPFVAASNRAFLILGTSGAHALWLLAGIALYCGAGQIADRASSAKQGSANSNASIDYRGLEEIGISILGLYLLTYGLAEGAYYWARFDLYYRYAAEVRFQTPPIPQEEYGGLAATGTRIILGLIFLFSSRGITTLRRRILDLRPLARPDN